MTPLQQRELRRLQTAIGMFEAGVDLMRQNLRRADPAATDAEIRERIGAWLRERPGAEWGDGEGTPVPWPRPPR